jgi:CHAT domain-containing protein
MQAASVQPTGKLPRTLTGVCRPKDRLIAVVLLALVCAEGAMAQVASISSAVKNAATDLVQPGVVVEKLDQGSRAAKAGLREGDVLLSWSRGTATGTMTSPFAVRKLEIEQSPLGAVTLEGLRRGQRQSWVISQPDWKMSTRPNFASSLERPYRLGLQFTRSGDVSRGVAYWRRAAIRAAGSQHAWIQAWFFLRMAKALSEARQWKEADAAYEQSVRLSPKSRLDILTNLFSSWASSFRDRQDWASAERNCEKALAHARDSEADSLDAAFVLSDHATVAEGKGDLFRAEEYAEEALKIREKMAPGSLVVAWSLDHLAQLAADREDLARAEEYAHRALTLHLKLNPSGTSLWFAWDLDILARIAWYRGDFAAAEGHALEALKIQQELAPNQIYSVNTLDMLGIVAWYSGDFVRAKVYFRQELKIIPKLAHGTVPEAGALENLAVACIHDGELREGEDYLRKVLVLSGKLPYGGYLTSASLDALGMIAVKRGDLAGAEKYFTEAIARGERTTVNASAVAEYLSDLAGVLETKGDLGSSEKAYRRALAIQEKVGTGTGRYADILASIARIMHHRGKDSEALQYYEQALTTLESQTARLGGSDEVRADFRAQHGSSYAGYAEVLLAQKQPEHAFEILERSRARTLLETLATAHVDVRKGVDPDLIQKERVLEADIRIKSERRIHLLGGEHTDEQVRAIEKDISDLTFEFQNVEAHIRAVSPSYAALTQPQSLSAAEIQRQLLDPETLLLEYSLGEERSYVFVVTPDSLEAFELPKRSDIEKASRRLYGLLTARNRGVRGETQLQQRRRAADAEGAYAKAAADLSQMILGPVAGQLRDKRLLIVADGALQYVPFAALPEPAGLHADQAEQTPLAVGHEIVNLPSASVLAVLRQEEKGRTPAPKAVAVLADPVFDRQDARVTLHAIARTRARLLSAPSSAGLLTRSAGDIGLSRNGHVSLPRLRFSRLEAEAIMQVTPAGSGMKAVDFAANRATATSAELGQYRIVHFATHGLLNSEHPELSGLVLSLVDQNGKPQEGFLQLQDIYNLNLPADLVVLSACETGLGKEINGEGLIGLTRGFMYAGASRVVASLWKVSDAATARLMADFYKAMESDGLPPAAALRAAQIQMWKQKRWSSPYYWAAFQIQGEWK